MKPDTREQGAGAMPEGKVTSAASTKKKTPKPAPLWMQWAVWVLRIVVGGIFVLSGLVKGIDLWGFLFKLEEYLAAWDWTMTRSAVLMGAMAVSAYELVFGFLLATGCYKRVAPCALLLQMVVMLPLTAYIAIANPVSDCGCFGDFWVISNTATLIKNLLLTAGLVFLTICNRRVTSGLYKPAIQWMVVTVVTLYIITVGLYGYNIQPMLDFRSFPTGTLIVPDYEEEDDGDSLPTYIYEKDGMSREFPADELPDSTWTFVERRDDGTADKHAADGSFAIYDEDDEDVAQFALVSEGKQLLVVIPELRMADISYTYFINDLYEQADSAGIDMACLIGASQKGIALWKDISMAAYPCYSVEDTTLKELSRGVISLVLVEDGRIRGKATLSSLVDGQWNQTNPLAVVGKLDNPRYAMVFTILTTITVGILLLLDLFQGLILALRSAVRKRYRRKKKAANEPEIGQKG